MNLEEIKKEQDDIERKMGPLQRRLWKLFDLWHKVRVEEVLKSGVLKTMSWRVRINHLNAYLQYEREDNLQLKGKRWPDIMDEIIPYPHSHFEMGKGATLNQDDGDITITFDTVYHLQKFIFLHDLRIIEWWNLRDLLKKVRPYRSLYKILQKRKEVNHGD